MEVTKKNQLKVISADSWSQISGGVSPGEFDLFPMPISPTPAIFNPPPLTVWGTGMGNGIDDFQFATIASIPVTSNIDVNVLAFGNQDIIANPSVGVTFAYPLP